MLQWLAVLLGCAFLYDKVAPIISSPLHLSLLSANMFGYLLLAMVIIGVFSMVRRYAAPRLAGSDIFGQSEYFLGMASGLVRFGCIALAGLALLHARYFSPTEVRAMEAFQNDVYGSDLFPTWHTAQAMVFEKSFCGQMVKEHFGPILIKPAKAQDTSIHQKDVVLPY